jgi:prophage maintenance system killer protein
VRNHAFSDGNKRAALIATDVFLQLNGAYLEGLGGQRTSCSDQAQALMPQRHLRVRCPRTMTYLVQVGSIATL